MDETPAAEGLPPSLRFLKWLVIVLTLTMIGGVITVVSLLVTRMPDSLGVVPQLPPGITLPDGTTAQAVTLGQGWIGVVTKDNRFMIYGEDGVLRQEMVIQTKP